FSGNAAYRRTDRLEACAAVRLFDLPSSVKRACPSFYSFPQDSSVNWRIPSLGRGNWKGVVHACVFSPTSFLDNRRLRCLQKDSEPDRGLLSIGESQHSVMLLREFVSPLLFSVSVKPSKKSTFVPSCDFAHSGKFGMKWPYRELTRHRPPCSC
ncbi:unnamed protein product, partial [Ectocarpus sp. 8 AP-2014]